MKKISLNRLAKLMAARPETPDGKADGVEVQSVLHAPGDELTVVSLRNALLTGWQPTKVRFDHPVRIRQLTAEDHGTWMTDSPQEVYQMGEMTKRMKGRVLIGGLGLGIASHFCAMKRKTKVTTVEVNEAVIHLVREHLTPKAREVVQQDIYEFCRELKPGLFDSALLDTWQSTGEWCWRSEVVPLRRLLRNKVSVWNIVCWQEDEMFGQLRGALTRAAYMDIAGMPDIYAVFRKALDRGGVLPEPVVCEGMTREESCLQVLKLHDPSVDIPFSLVVLREHFLTGVGTDVWERDFGDLWDKHVKPEAKVTC